MCPPYFQNLSEKGRNFLISLRHGTPAPDTSSQVKIFSHARNFFLFQCCCRYHQCYHHVYTFFWRICFEPHRKPAYPSEISRLRQRGLHPVPQHAVGREWWLWLYGFLIAPSFPWPDGPRWWSALKTFLAVVHGCGSQDISVWGLIGNVASDRIYQLWKPTVSRL